MTFWVEKRRSMMHGKLCCVWDKNGIKKEKHERKFDIVPQSKAELEKESQWIDSGAGRMCSYEFYELKLLYIASEPPHNLMVAKLIWKSIFKAAQQSAVEIVAHTQQEVGVFCLETSIPRVCVSRFSTHNTHNKQQVHHRSRIDDKLR